MVPDNIWTSDSGSNATDTTRPTAISGELQQPAPFWTTINKEMVEMAFYTLDQGQKEMMDNLLEKFAWDHQELQFNKQCVNRAFDEVKNEMAHTSSMTTLDIRNLSEMIQRLAANTDAALKNSQANKED